MLVVVSTTMAFCSNARAADAWLCSVHSAVAVDEDGTVGPPDLGDRERPTFFRVDAERGELKLLAPVSRRGEVTKIDLVHETDGTWVFSGVEHGRGLNLIIAADGRLSLSVVGDGVIWSVFGHALPTGDSTTDLDAVADAGDKEADAPIADSTKETER
jgi:hypothetical protein